MTWFKPVLTGKNSGSNHMVWTGMFWFKSRVQTGLNHLIWTSLNHLIWTTPGMVQIGLFKSRFGQAKLSQPEPNMSQTEPCVTWVNPSQIWAKPSHAWRRGKPSTRLPRQKQSRVGSILTRFGSHCRSSAGAEPVQHRFTGSAPVHRFSAGSPVQSVS